MITRVLGGASSPASSLLVLASELLVFHGVMLAPLAPPQFATSIITSVTCLARVALKPASILAIRYLVISGKVSTLSSFDDAARKCSCDNVR
jgi:hypothetical protein